MKIYLFCIPWLKTVEIWLKYILLLFLNKGAESYASVAFYIYSK